MSRDHTERMMRLARVPFERDGLTVRVSQVDELELDELRVPGDPSSAAFIAAAALLVSRSRVVIEDVGLNWTRTGFFRIAERMGAILLGDLEEPGTESEHEPIGELDVARSPLVGTEVGGDEVPLAIDELTLVGLLGAFAEGETVVRDAAELRVKESDRIAVLVESLNALGADAEELPDGFVVRGDGGPCAAAPSTPTATTAWPCWARWRAWPRWRESRSRGWMPPGSPTRASRRTSGRCWATRFAAVIVAIDGPAGAGKSTVARATAEALGFTYLDSGAMYRAVGLAVLREGGVPSQRARELDPDFADSPDLRTPEVSEEASRIAQDAGVRSALVDKQRELMATGDWVAEGRDIGTVVAPDAELKVFLTASAEERARRRAQELGTDVETVQRDQALRDAQDESREHSPLKAADDSVEVDTTGLSIDEVVERIVALVDR